MVLETDSVKLLYKAMPPNAASKRPNLRATVLIGYAPLNANVEAFSKLTECISASIEVGAVGLTGAAPLKFILEVLVLTYTVLAVTRILCAGPTIVAVHVLEAASNSLRMILKLAIRFLGEWDVADRFLERAYL